jgi:peptidoglycan/LPS O-acetylase OafA/YrhL
MRQLNILRSIVLSIGAGYLIFSQDHSAPVGIQLLQFVSIALVVGSLVMLRVPKLKLSFKEVAIPTGIALVVAILSVALGGQYAGENTDELFTLRSLVVLFVVGMAVLEFTLSLNAKPEDVLELRISATLGALTGLLFSFAPLDDLNSVGFFSAYLAISAVQRGVWAATPTNRKKIKNA